MQDKVRLKLVLGKYRIANIAKVPLGFEMVLELGGSVKMTVSVPDICDIREGDLLTLYTEVYTNAQPSGSPIQ